MLNCISINQFASWTFALPAESKTMMRDNDIRRELDSLLHWRHSYENDTLIRHEMGLCANRRRIDIAVINGEISGYEIKSDADRLTRLARQAHTYELVLDRATLVTTQRHLKKAEDILPTWWGITLARPDHGLITLDVVRDAHTNTAQDPISIAQLLWREEAMQELKALGLSKGLSKTPRHYVWLELAQAIPIDDLRRIVRERLKGRQDWPGGLPRGQSDGTRSSITTR